MGYPIFVIAWGCCCGVGVYGHSAHSTSVLGLKATVCYRRPPGFIGVSEGWKKVSESEPHLLVGSRALMRGLAPPPLSKPISSSSRDPNILSYSSSSLSCVFRVAIA